MQVLHENNIKGGLLNFRGNDLYSNNTLHSLSDYGGCRLILAKGALEPVSLWFFPFGLLKEYTFKMENREDQCNCKSKNH